MKAIDLLYFAIVWKNLEKFAKIRQLIIRLPIFALNLKLAAWHRGKHSDLSPRRSEFDPLMRHFFKKDLLRFQNPFANYVISANF